MKERKTIAISAAGVDLLNAKLDKLPEDYLGWNVIQVSCSFSNSAYRNDVFFVVLLLEKN